MHALFLCLYIALPLATWWRSRSLSWTVIYTVGSVSIFGVGVNFVIDYLTSVTWFWLEVTMTAALLVPAVLAFLVPPRRDAPRRRQVTAIGLPVLALAIFLIVMTTWWTQVPAFNTPVSFLMNYATAEDNAKWLDFAALMATGDPIDQGVPLGGPLQLFLVAVGSLMAVVSQVTFGGVNEVMVAANSVIYGQFALVALSPLALAPLAEARLPRRASQGGYGRIPAPFIWVGALILVAGSLVSVTYGHLTWQFVALVVSLWISTYLIDTSVIRARLLTSLAVAACMTVWFPLNVIAAVLLGGWLVVLVRSAARGRGLDVLGFALWAAVSVALWQPLRSSFDFVTDIGFGSIGAAGAVAMTAVPRKPIFAFLDSTLFAAGGGVESAGPLLVMLAVVAALGTAVVREQESSANSAYVRLVPIGLLAGFVAILQILDQWTTGSGPHYGSTKFAFFTVVTVASSAIPLALMLLSPSKRGMTAARWVGVGAVVFVLVLDSLLVKAISVTRPDQWSPPVPFDNPRSYWWPADVNASAEQPISLNPVGCVYLPAGAKAPSGILDSGLSDPQRVYTCTRLLAGLSGEDAGAQPMVDWLRREWLTNERAWEGVYGYLAGMPDSTLDKDIILLDDGSNVVGLESMRSLLNRFPAGAWSEP